MSRATCGIVRFYFDGEEIYTHPKCVLADGSHHHDLTRNRFVAVHSVLYGRQSCLTYVTEDVLIDWTHRNSNSRNCNNRQSHKAIPNHNDRFPRPSVLIPNRSSLPINISY